MLASLVYIIDLAALVGAYALVPQTTWLTVVSVLITLGGFVLFGIIAYIGEISFGLPLFTVIKLEMLLNTVSISTARNIV